MAFGLMEGRPLSLEKDTLFLSLKEKGKWAENFNPHANSSVPHTVMWSLSVRLLSTIYFFCWPLSYLCNLCFRFCFGLHFLLFTRIPFNILPFTLTVLCLEPILGPYGYSVRLAKLCTNTPLFLICIFMS